MKKIIQLVCLIVLSTGLNACYIQHLPQEQHSYAQQILEARTAKKIQRQLQKALEVWIEPNAVRVHVRVQMNLDAVKAVEHHTPRGQRLLEESESNQSQEQDDSGVESENESAARKFHAVYHHLEIERQSAQIEHLGIVVQLDSKRLGEEKAEELEELVYELVEALLLIDEDRGDRLEVLSYPFAM